MYPSSRAVSPRAQPKDEVGEQRRVLLYSHDGLGLGHLRRTLSIAAALAQRRPDAALMAITGSPYTYRYAQPPNFDSVKLPSIDKRRLFSRASDQNQDARATEDIFLAREAIIGAVLDSYAPHLVVVDQEPAGLAGELLPALSRLESRKPRPRLVLGLRDITYGPEETRFHWQSEGAYDLLDGVYDHILVYGTQSIFDPIQAYGLSQVASAKTIFTGYFRRPEPVLPASAIRDRLGARSLPLVVVTVGGGMDGGPVLRAYLGAIRQGHLAGVVSYVVAGPQLPDVELVQIRTLAHGLHGLVMVQFSDDLISYIAAADAVVTMGGYNAVCEAVGAGKHPIVIPRAGGSQEQQLRGERFAHLGLVTHLPLSEVTPERLAQAIGTELGRSTSPPAILDFGGLERASDVLIRALEK